MSKQNTSKLSPTAEKIEQAASILGEFEPGYLPPPLFSEIARLVTTPIVEVVPLHIGEDGKLQVLLTQRGANDPFWANQFHVPGTVVLATDQKGGFVDAFKRIFEDELGNITVVKEPVMFAQMHRKTARGSEVALLYWAVVEGEPKDGVKGRYFNVEELPKEVVRFTNEVIEGAVKSFEAYSSKLDSNPAGVT